MISNNCLRQASVCFRKISKAILIWAYLGLIFTGTVSCKTTKSVASEAPAERTAEDVSSLWQEHSRGFSILDSNSSGKAEKFQSLSGFKTDYKKPLKFYAAKINLSDPDLKVHLYASSPEKWENTKSVESFAKEHNTTVAINTTPFQIKQYINPFSKAKPAGINISQGKLISPAAKGYAALLLKKEKSGYSAKIVKSQSTEDYSWDFAAGGFFMILEDGNIITKKNDRNTRCSAGINQETNELIILCGTKMTYVECARILKILGASEAMEFDGGNSTNLVIGKKSKLKELITRTVPAIIGFGK